MTDRIEYQDGELDEIVVSGSAHLERIGNREWFLNMVNADGSSHAMWFTSKDLHKAQVEFRKPAVSVENPCGERE